MKKIFKTVAFLLASAYAFAQAPQSFNYQGLARDNAGTAMATKTISVKATILDGTATGTSVYSETFSVSTNAFGLFTLGIGSGTPVAGTFSAIKWSTGNKFLKIEIDPNGGSSYALSGTTQLLSVPYAMYAASAGDSKWSDVAGGISYSSGGVGIGVSNLNGNALYLSKNATGTDRKFALIENTSNQQDSYVNSVWNAGTGTNNNYFQIQVNAESYFPNTLKSNGQTHLLAKKLVLRSQTPTSSSDGYVAINTGGAFDGTADYERLRVDYLGNIGINTTTPTQKLDVNGKVRVQDLALNSAASKVVVADANGVLGYKDASTLGGSQWTNNNGGINFSTGKVGIGTSTPTAWLSIEKNVSGADRPLLTVDNISNLVDSYSGTSFSAGTGANKASLSIQVNSEGYYPELGTGGQSQVVAKQLVLRSQPNTNPADGFVSIYTGGTYDGLNTGAERLRVTHDGKIGIGTTTPKAKLQITSGDVYLDDATKGIIMKNAANECYRVTVGTAGALVSTLVTCP